jgi:hypothetical protein
MAGSHVTVGAAGFAALLSRRRVSSKTTYNKEDPNKGHDHTFFIQHSRDVFAD